MILVARCTSRGAGGEGAPAGGQGDFMSWGDHDDVELLVIGHILWRGVFWVFLSFLEEKV